MARRRKLIIYGNCQAGAVSDILRLVPEIAENWEVVIHQLWQAGEALERQLVDFADADTLLLQDVRNWRQHPLRDALPDGLRVVRFPFIYVAALWPFDSFIAGEDKAMNREMVALGQAGTTQIPFGFQDAVLGRMRAEVADPEERLRRYRALEFENPPDLVRYAEFEAARLLDGDRKTGMSIGRFVIDRYRDQRLFHAIVHPAAELVEQLAWEILPRMGIEIARANVPCFSNDYMRAYQVPLHPEVIRSLGLTWVTPNSDYAQLNGEKLTFDEYYGRYARYPMREAMA